jgi:hypothetical protein
LINRFRIDKPRRSITPVEIVVAQVCHGISVVQITRRGNAKQRIDQRRITGEAGWDLKRDNIFIISQSNSVIRVVIVRSIILIVVVVVVRSIRGYRERIGAFSEAREQGMQGRSKIR